MIKLFKAPELNEIKVKKEAISKHLINMLPGCKVRYKHDVNADAVVFYIKISEITKEFSICDQYLQDSSTIEAFDFIKKNEVIKIISTHGKVKVVIREGYPAISYR
ncbi:MAG: hypothetical protein K8R50_08245 [Betaproteobacteria bacterium]|nr:hypothetical protein [Betaproteobacteria bacterium]MCX7196118.1 hypothetical protein [Pseudomonadota bacterium]